MLSSSRLHSGCPCSSRSTGLGSGSRQPTFRLNAVCVAPSTSVHQDTRAFTEEFSLGCVLGHGSFGEVKVALKKGTVEEFAVKTVPKGSSMSSIPSEIVNWQLVNSSQYVAKLEGVCEDMDGYHIVQELCCGGDLQTYLDNHDDPMEEYEVVQVMRSVLMFLSQCHSNSICYGDVKPANFLIKSMYPCVRHLIDPEHPKGPIHIKAADFGSSQQCDPAVRLRRTVGTPLYMAPEMYARSYSVEADMFSAGVMLYQLLTGRYPFWDFSEDLVRKLPAETIQEGIRTGAVFFDSTVWCKLSPEVQDLIKAMLVKTPSARITAEQALEHPWFQKVWPQAQAAGAAPLKSSGSSVSNIVPLAPALQH